MLHVSVVLVDAFQIQSGELQRKIARYAQNRGWALLPGNGAVAGVQSDDAAVLEPHFQGGRFPQILECPGQRCGFCPGVKRRTFRLHLGLRSLKRVASISRCLAAWCMANLGDEIDNCGLFLEQRRRHIFCSGKLSMQQPEHSRILPAIVQPLNFLGQPDEERPSKHQP